MSKALIITEKPSVARDFARVLGVASQKRNNGYIEGDNYVVTWCVGHLVEMCYPEVYDEKYGKWRLEDLPFLPKEYKYDVIPSVAGQYDIVHSLLFRDDIDTVYWAGDSGKEGQTIEENIRNFGGVRAGMEEKRVWIDSQTDEEIMRGIREAKPMSDYANLGKSGIMRSIEDYAMGINFSRVLSVKYGRMVNDAASTKSYTAVAVGRVMTCVLGMVVIREREIRNFVETPFYRVIAMIGNDGIEGEWKAQEGSKYFNSPLLYKENGFKKEEDASAFMDSLTGKDGVIDTLEMGTSKKRAPLLFNLAELQAECSKRFKISPDETLSVAQDLYERKLTTYPRTDARVLTSAVAKEIAKNIRGLKAYSPVAGFVDKIFDTKTYIGIAKTAYTDDAKVTDHYAIIPTGQTQTLGSLSELHQKVYDLIVRRFLSIFYPPAEYQTVKMVVKVDGESFFTQAKLLKVPGFLEIAGKQAINDEDKEKENKTKVEPKQIIETLSKLKQGDLIQIPEYVIKEGKTSPPKRYTSGSMILAMENAGQLIEDEELREQIKGSGIGTSATRAGIIEKLVRIGYLNLNKKSQVLSPENLGEMVYEIVNAHVPQLLNPKMSASWEKGLDGITKGEVSFEDYRQKLEEFIRAQTVAMIGTDLKSQIAGKIHPFTQNRRGLGTKISLGVPCPVCGGTIETTPFGYGCSNYKKDDENSCKFSIGQIAGRTLSLEEAKQLLTDGKTDVLTGFVSKAKKKFDAALVLQKDEQGKVQIAFDFENVGPKIVKDTACPVCGGEIMQTAFGWGCSNYQKDDPNSCRFSVGKILGKSLSEKQLKELIANGKTDTIRGFKAKSGKKFDARLVLEKDDGGKVTGIGFDFSDIEPVKLKDVVCPVCGGDIIINPYGYVCANNKRDEEDSCKFFIGKIAGLKLKDAQVRQLLTQKHTDPIEGFIAKSGMFFTAPLKLTDDGKIEFDFPKKPDPVETKLPCPRCQKHLYKNQYSYDCECGFKLRTTVARLALSDEQIGQLILDGQTKEIVTGFTSKAGTLFDAYLKREDDHVSFVFDKQPTERITGQSEQATSVSNHAGTEEKQATENPAANTSSDEPDQWSYLEQMASQNVNEPEEDVPPLDELPF